MIKIENVDVYGWEAAIRGMRNPLNSWDKSDSTFIDVFNDRENIRTYYQKSVDIGENDLKLMKQLVKAGTDHSKFMRMIMVTLDITAPMYWWKEASTYKVGTVRNSCSTMHTIHKKEFTLDDFSHEHLTDCYDSNGQLCCEFGWTLECLINDLNAVRELYLETKDKKYWWQMIQILPSSYNQRSTVQLNYVVLRNIYHSRKAHKLDEWRDFCKWIESLPYSGLITMEV